MTPDPAAHNQRLKLRLLIISGVGALVLLVCFFLFYFIEDVLDRSVFFQVTLALVLGALAIILTHVMFYYEELARSRKNLIEKLNKTIEEKDIEPENFCSLSRQLEKSKKMEALGLLVGGVAHDLNNILSGMMSIPQMLLLDLPEDSPLREPIEVILDSGRRAGKIVEELLTIGRGTTMTTGPVFMNDIVRNALSSPEFHLLNKYHPHVNFKTDLDPDLPYIKGSQVHLQKALLNLAVNAAEATKSFSQVLIRTRQICFSGKQLTGYDKIKDGTYVQLSIADQGEGISKETLEHIFEPFYTKKKLGRSGTGLGLYIVWNTVHDHKGYICVDAGIKKTAFHLFFPESDGLTTPSKVVPDDPVEDYAGHGEHILVVDDLQIQRQIATIMLTRIGYRVSALSSGEEAIEFIKNNPVDLAVLDMIMEPKMNGLDVFRALRQIDPDIRAVITSGYPITPDVKKAQTQGAGPFVKKPYHIEQIGRAIKKALASGGTTLPDRNQ